MYHFEEYWVVVYIKKDDSERESFQKFLDSCNLEWMECPNKDWIRVKRAVR